MKEYVPWNLFHIKGRHDETSTINYRCAAELMDGNEQESEVFVKPNYYLH